jgi:hypothetical protein
MPRRRLMIRHRLKSHRRSMIRLRFQSRPS